MESQRNSGETVSGNSRVPGPQRVVGLILVGAWVLSKLFHGSGPETHQKPAMSESAMRAVKAVQDSQDAIRRSQMAVDAVRARGGW